MTTTHAYIIERDKEFLKFLKGRYPFFHLSNVFFRDLHYGVMAFLEQNKVKSTYPSAEDVTRDVISHFEEQKIFQRIDDKTWLLHYPEFKAVAPKKTAAKPAPAKPAAARPAGATPAVPAKADPAASPAKAPQPAAPPPAGKGTDPAPATTADTAKSGPETPTEAS